jgi:acyl-CoA thioester hydrolase
MREHRTRRRIEFSDTDAGGIAHFARFFVFMEIAEHELLRSLGADPGAREDADGRLIGWPRVASSCEFLSPARFGDQLDVHVQVVRVGRTSLTFGFALSRDGTPVALGRTTTVCAQLNAPGGIRPFPIPAELRARLEEAPAAGADSQPGLPALSAAGEVTAERLAAPSEPSEASERSEPSEPGAAATDELATPAAAPAPESRA